MKKIKWLSVLLCASLLLSQIASANAAQAGQQIGGSPAHRDPGLIRQMINGDPASFYLPQTSPAPESLLPQTTAAFPTWSRLAFQSYRNNNWDIYLVDPGGANESRLTSNTSIEVDPSLAKGGSLVAFDSNRGGNYDIYTQNADGSNVKKLAANSAADSVPVFSPDGSRIVFMSARSGNSDLWVMNADGSGLTQITNSPAYDGEPTWSPDGMQIAFVSKRNGSYDLWKMNADGSNLVQLTNGLYTGTPAWSPLGDKIAFSADINGDSFYELYIMNADGSNRTFIASGNPRDYWGASWSPDGKYFAVISTDWTYYQNNWYWTNSLVVGYDVAGVTFVSLGVSDSRVMRVSWASTDDTPPTPCTVSLAASQNWDTFSLAWSATDAASGLASYDVQARTSQDGSWRDFLTQTIQTGGIYAGIGDGQYDFRCRATDNARNVAAWDKAPIASTIAHSSRPSSTVIINQRYAKGPVQVSWIGADTNDYITKYDIWVRDGTAGDWTLWQNGVTVTQAQYSGASGHTYYFRSLAHDLAGHSQEWQPTPQAAVTFYDTALTVLASDVRSNQLPVPPVVLTPQAPATDSPGQTPFEKHFGLLASASPVKIDVTPQGSGSLPDTMLDASNDRTFMLTLPPSDDAAVNGGFEVGDFTGWTLSGDGASVASTTHTGQYSAKLVPGTTGASDFSQSVTVAADMQHPTLSFLYHLLENSTADQFTVKVSGDHELDVLATKTVTADWTHAWADLAEFSGQTVAVSFQVSGSGAAVYIDEVSLGSWTAPQVASVSPSSWEAGEQQTITITGENFTSLPEVYLNNTAMKNVQWISATQISAQAPIGLRGGTYRLRVVNPDGGENDLADMVTLTPLPVYFPLVTRSGAATSAGLPDWPTLGGDVRHSGFASNAPAVSRYSLAWSINPLHGTNPIKEVVEADGIVVVAVQQFTSFSGIIAYDVESGKELWRFPFNGKIAINAATIANGRVYFEDANADNSAYLSCVDLYSGDLIWQTPFGNEWVRYLHPLVVGQNIYIDGNGNDYMHIFNAANGKMAQFLWITYATDWTPAYADGKVYSRNFEWFAENDPVTGQVTWFLTVDIMTNVATAPVIGGRTAYIAGISSLSAINLDTHSLSWKAVGSFYATMPAVAGNSVYALNGSRLDVRDAATGSLLKSYTAPDTLLNAPVVTSTAVFVSTASNTYELDRNTLNVVWSAPEGGELTVADGYLFIARTDGYVSAYRAQEP